MTIGFDIGLVTTVLHPISAKILLPFRSLVSQSEVTLTIPPDNWETRFKLSYRNTFEGGFGRRLDASVSTIVRVETSYPRYCTDDEFWGWIQTDHEAVIDGFILPRLNRFLLYLKYAVRPEEFPVSLVTGMIREVGPIDVVASRVEHLGKIIPSYGISSTSLAAGRGLRRSQDRSPPPEGGSGEVPKEWAVIVRAADLVNRGYHLEGFVVGFSLLDDKVQEFLRAHEFSNRDLRAVEGDRLRVFIQDLTKKIGGRTPLENNFLGNEFARLNRKPNLKMHAGESCTRNEAERGLRVILKLLQFYVEIGANYTLPVRLDFYRRPIAIPAK